LNDSKARLQLFQKELNYNADRDDSLSFLRKTYAKVLAGSKEEAVFTEEDIPEASEVSGITEEEIIKS